MDTRVTAAELEIMEVLWEAGRSLTATEIADRLETRDWSLATVKTLLSRLREKQAVRHVVDGRRFLYSPALERDRYAGGETKRLIDRLFGGRLSPLVARLADEEALDAADIADIEELLRKLKK